MAEIVLNNYSDDSRIKQYIRQNLMPRVFHDIPMNALNTGAFSIISEYISQATEQISFTNSFYFNESFITKAVLPDSIYAEAAIFNLGYGFATPSSTEILLELRMEELINNATYNAESGLYEFILDKDTKFNLPNGNVYSLDYDILLQYRTVETATRSTAAMPAWNVQYTNFEEGNVVAINKQIYIPYRVTDTWMCLFVHAAEYTRRVYHVVNNAVNGIPNEDYLIKVDEHICGFDVVYVKRDGTRIPIPHSHILFIHDEIDDMDPYLHYIMDNQNTIRLMFQLLGTRYFVPEVGSQYEITVYTCHGEAANFTEAPKVQPNVITSTGRYANNANVMKAGFVINGSLGGSNIGNAELVRRETIEAYNTANVISTDHDIDEWFKTFYFKNILYPFFFKRRDDPWGRIWSGYLALKDDEDHVYNTSTLHAKINYRTLYNNKDNIISSDEIIIPPGFVWVYGDENRYTVVPYLNSTSGVIETAKTLESIPRRYAFANPFGIRIQKDPFAIAYLNPWIDDYVAPVMVPGMNAISVKDVASDEIAVVYHATPIYVNISRTYKDDYYHFETWIDVSQIETVDGQSWVKYLMRNIAKPSVDDIAWTYLRQPLDWYAKNIPFIRKTTDDGYLPFNPYYTYICVRNIYERDDGTYTLSDVWIDDMTNADDPLQYNLQFVNIEYLYGLAELWGEDGIREGVIINGENAIRCSGINNTASIVVFGRYATFDYYTLKLRDHMYAVNANGERQTIAVESVTITVTRAYKTERRKFGEAAIYNVGDKYRTVTLNVKFNFVFTEETYDDDGDIINIKYGDPGIITETYRISNAVDVCLPYPDSDNIEPEYHDGMYSFTYPVGAGSIQNNYLEPDTVIAYAVMRPAASTDSVDYYRIPFSSIPDNTPAFYARSNSLPLEQNNMRVLLHAYVNGAETGHVEMIPVDRDQDGTYLYQVDMHPLNELLDIDNMIHVASLDYGGGNWVTTRKGSVVNVDALNPELRISILFKSYNNEKRESDIILGDEYTGYLLNDQYYLKDVSLVQEMKEMRSVVNFYESSIPTDDQVTWYDSLMLLNRENHTELSMYDILKKVQDQMLYKKVMSDDDRKAFALQVDEISKKIDTRISQLLTNDKILSEDSEYALSDGLIIIRLAFDQLISKTYSELYTYADENIVVCYAKEYDVRYAGFISTYSIYYDFIKNHPESLYDASQDIVVINRTYVENLLADFISEYPYSYYKQNFDQFKIYQYPISFYQTSRIEKTYIGSEELYMEQVLELLKKTISVIPYIKESDISLLKSGLTAKSYAKLYKDSGCTVEIEKENGKFYVIQEDRKLDTVYYCDNDTLTELPNCIVWENIYNVLNGYQTLINETFISANVNGGMEIQLVPFVEYSLMNTDKFKDFVHTFTQVHRAIEPVIFKRLEGNHYLDCKLVATYGLPHSYCADKQYFLEGEFWPDLHVYISFDVKLYNRAFAANTIADLRSIVRAYFNRLTTVHTPAQLVTMNNNIYVSHLIQQMEEHKNVAYMKFNGWYTNERFDKNGNYMSPEIQAIVQKWRTLESMPTDELERYVPEMFVLEDNDIEINIIDDSILA